MEHPRGVRRSRRDSGPGALESRSRCLGWMAVFLLASPAELVAQGAGFGVESRAGIGLPVGELSEFLDPGPTFGVKLLFGLSDRLSVTADGAVRLLQGRNPDVTVWSYLGGLRIRLVGRSGSKWSVVAEAAAGGVSFGTGAAVILINPQPDFPPPRATLLETSPALRTGLGVERRLGDRFAWFLDAAWLQMFTDAEDVTIEGRGTTEGFGATSTVPITLGLQFRP